VINGCSAHKVSNFRVWGNNSKIRTAPFMCPKAGVAGILSSFSIGIKVGLLCANG
jgi:hypothetical protein